MKKIFYTLALWFMFQVFAPLENEDCQCRTFEQQEFAIEKIGENTFYLNSPVNCEHQKDKVNFLLECAKSVSATEECALSEFHNSDQFYYRDNEKRNLLPVLKYRPQSARMSIQNSEENSPTKEKANADNLLKGEKYERKRVLQGTDY